MLAQNGDVFWILTSTVKVCSANFEKELNIDVVVDGTDKEVECQEEVEEIDAPSLLDKSPAYESLQSTGGGAEAFGKLKPHLKDELFHSRHRPSREIWFVPVTGAVNILRSGQNSRLSVRLFDFNFWF